MKKLFENFVNSSKFINNQNNFGFEKQSLTLLESTLKYVCSIPLLPFGFFTVDANNICVIRRFGKFERNAYPGLRYSLPFQRQIDSIFVGAQSLKISKSKVVDRDGKPLIISAVVNYRTSEPEKFVINIKSDLEYIHNQSDSVIKNVAALYPYDSPDGKNLRTETVDITNTMKLKLQELVNLAGINIFDIRLTDLNYAPEIAQSMMIKQQAQESVNAKKLITESAIGIVKDTVEKLDEMKINMNEEEKRRLVINLLTVITSGTPVQPTIQIKND